MSLKTKCPICKLIGETYNTIEPIYKCKCGNEGEEDFFTEEYKLYRSTLKWRERPKTESDVEADLTHDVLTKLHNSQMEDVIQEYEAEIEALKKQHERTLDNMTLQMLGNG
jgi:hypothetical protein